MLTRADVVSTLTDMNSADRVSELESALSGNATGLYRRYLAMARRADAAGKTDVAQMYRGWARDHARTVLEG